MHDDSVTHDADRAPSPTSRAQWLEPLAILLVVVLGYVLGPGRLPLLGEEPCRGLHGIEMAATGDWLLPTNQGVVILDRPPLQYWFLALIELYVHPLDPSTLRLSAAAVTLATALAVWFYARGFLTGAGRLVAGLAFPTLGHVFDLGRRAETDGLFALLLSAALLLWHYGRAKRWNPIWAWSASAFVAGLATLTKGTQGPIAFFGAVYLFLLLRRDWRALASVAHAAGLLAFLACVAAFQVPFHLRAGWDGTVQTWLAPFTDRLDGDPLRLARHMVTFPLETLAASLPWSVLALGLLHRGFWRGSERLRSTALFLVVGMAAIFGPVWISEGGKTRYIMPLYPLLAVACGAVVERALQPDAPRGLVRLWFGTLRTWATILFVASLASIGLTLASGGDASPAVRRWAQPAWMLALLALVTGIQLAFFFRGSAEGRAGLRAFSLACVVALFFNGPVLDSEAYTKQYKVEADVDELQQRLGGAPLYSFNWLHHQFLYYWYLDGEPIPILGWPEAADDVPRDLAYFAYNYLPGEEPELPFAWDEVMRIDPTPKRQPHPWILVGRRRTAD